MTDYIIGQNCHITLTHPAVNGGVPYGFLVNIQGGTRPGGVQITHEVDTYGTTRLWIHFDVLLADNAINPDGSNRETTRFQDYSMLMQYLNQLEKIELESPVGTYLNLGALGWTADERHLPLSSIIKCQINNAGVYWPPIDPNILSQCVWSDDDPSEPIPGTQARAWDSSYWR